MSATGATAAAAAAGAHERRRGGGGGAAAAAATAAIKGGLAFDEATHGALRSLARRSSGGLKAYLERGRADLLRRMAFAARHEASTEAHNKNFSCFLDF